MKVLFLTNNPEGKGTFWRCYGFAKQLVRRGHEVDLICLQNTKEWKITEKSKEGVKIVCLPSFFNWGIKEIPGHLYRTVFIVLLALRSNFDVVHVFNVAFPTCGLSVFFLWLFKTIRFKRYKIVVDWDDLWGKGGLTDWKEMGTLVISTADFLETKIPLLADKVTVVSDEIRRRSITAGVKPQKIVKIINGADVEAIKPMSKLEARKKLGLPTKGKIVCYAAASVTMNYKFIMSAFEQIAQKIKNVRLIILSPLKEFEKKIISESVATEKISIIGFEPYDKYLIYLAASDVLLLPRSSHILDRCEFPGRLGDYLASARPVITNYSGEPWRLIEESKAGLIAKVDDVNDFAEKTVKILNNSLLADKLSKNAKKAAENKYSWSKLAGELIKEVYE